MWYLHSHRVCANFLLISKLLSILRVKKFGQPENTDGSFVFQYSGIALVIHTSTAGGLALELPAGQNRLHGRCKAGLSG
jgi:hypothetical protein